MYSLKTSPFDQPVSDIVAMAPAVSLFISSWFILLPLKTQKGDMWFPAVFAQAMSVGGC
ncbi:hypothetical protein DPMN_008543 [Dreissena polymorpha]|uniref:Uncharacterized protein n=1 Tax=Dreissena polymorpha TaxID=45954 RepID=A0A9D4MYK8_DREPO|nr:hypothetical protein DPMN_008543 [Dreissena polymorpha]